MKNKRVPFLVLTLIATALLLKSGELRAQNSSPNTPVVANDSSEVVKKRLAVLSNLEDLEAHKAYLLAYLKYARANGVRDNYYDPLEKQYEDWSKKYPNSYVIPFAYGTMLTRSESPKAKPWLLKALKINPKSADVYDDLSSDAQRWGDFDAGRKYLQKAVEADPTNRDIAFQYAYSFEETNWDKYQSLSLDFVKRFPTHQRGRNRFTG